MKRLTTVMFTIFTITLFLNLAVSENTKACKDIIACGNATAGDYNLLLKVRDPSRPGLQVLCIVPEGYEYTYHHPWTGKDMKFITNHKFIGVATEGDTIPNIVKAGMTLSDAGIAYGDADTGSRWINPTKNAWDDFDWIRYACEKADDEDQAVYLLTKECVDQLHASGVSENLFVVGPNKGFVVGADAFHYTVEEVDDIVVMSNYPDELWKTQYLKTRPISRSFDTVVEKSVRKGGVVRLQSISGIKIVDIGGNYISVRLFPFSYALKTGSLGKIFKIQMGERKTVGDYSVRLLNIDGKKAKISLCYKFKAWEEAMMDHIQPKYGSIDIKEMINWSRLHETDLEDLRPMCQDFYQYETVAIYKIPQQNYEILSSGWFSPNHACSSIYVPFHICDKDIYEPYTTGEAAKLSMELLDSYGHDVLNTYFSNVEEVFLYETDIAEDISKDMVSDSEKLSSFLTTVDMGMQKQAWLTEQLWMELSQMSNQNLMDVVGDLWKCNYSESLKSMNATIYDLKESSSPNVFIDIIGDITSNICQSRIAVAKILEKSVKRAEQEYKKGKNFFDQGEYSSAFSHFEQAFEYADKAIKGFSATPLNIKTEDEKPDFLIQYMIILLLIGAIFIIWAFRPK